jgi:hypothetical protein
VNIYPADNLIAKGSQVTGYQVCGSLLPLGTLRMAVEVSPDLDYLRRYLSNLTLHYFSDVCRKFDDLSYSLLER